MKLTVCKKGAGKNLAGSIRKFGETFDCGTSAGRVYVAVGFAEVAKPVKSKPVPIEPVTAEDSTPDQSKKRSYQRRDMTAETDTE